jgi:phosphoglycerate dehydrogenase-like enzyme
MTNKPMIAVLPDAQSEYLAAVALGGGIAADLNATSTGLVWTDSADSVGLAGILRSHPNIDWVQLPFAGVDNFKAVFDEVSNRENPPIFTSAKGAYREPVAEHALMLALALARVLPERIRARAWGRKYADTLFDAKVVILGGGGISQEIARLLAPFRADVTVVRKNLESIPNVSRVLGLDSLSSLLPDADFVFLASALTEETRGLFDSKLFELMKDSAYLINIARGAIVDSAALENALISGQIAGAGIDVTDPEPLPLGHSLWNCPNLIITPHTADTPEMCIRLLSARIVDNVKALIAAKPLVGQVNLKLGY